MNIEFEQSASDALDALLNAPPKGQNGHSSNGGTKYQDLTLNAPFRSRVLKLPEGTTWVRFMPAIKGSRRSWMMQVERLELPNAKMLWPNGPLLAKARTYLAANNPDLVYSKQNREGKLKLWPKPLFLAWCIVEAMPEGQRLQIFAGSGYDGKRGANPGIGYKIVEAATETDQEPSSTTHGMRIHPDVADQEEGRLIAIIRKGTDQTSSYDCRVGKAAAPLVNYLEMLHDSEADLVRPLEDTIQTIDDETLAAALVQELGEDIVDKLRKS